MIFLRLVPYSPLQRRCATPWLPHPACGDLLAYRSSFMHVSLKGLCIMHVLSYGCLLASLLRYFAKGRGESLSLGCAGRGSLSFELVRLSSLPPSLFFSLFNSKRKLKPLRAE